MYDIHLWFKYTVIVCLLTMCCEFWSLRFLFFIAIYNLFDVYSITTFVKYGV